MYNINEGSLKIPKEWKDESINVLSSSMNKGGGLSFTITRDSLPWGMEFKTHADNELKAVGENLQNYKEINRSTGLIDDHNAIYSEYTWKSKDGPLHQMMVLIEDQTKVLIFTTTVLGKLSDSQKQQLIHIIDSFTFRKP